MIIRSSRVSRSAFFRTSSGTPILPTSWSRPPHSRASSSASETRITRPMSTAISLTRWLCRAVNGIALVDRLRQRADRLGEHLAHLDEPLRRHPGRVQRQCEQQRRPPLDGVDDRHQPSKRGECEVVERRSLGVADDDFGQRLTRPECENAASKQRIQKEERQLPRSSRRRSRRSGSLAPIACDETRQSQA